MRPKSRLLGFTVDGVSYMTGYAPDKPRTTKELAEMPYRDYLLTPEWRTRRRHLLQHADYRCQRCGSSEHLEVHHRTYDRRGNELPEDLEVLCAGCHREEHNL